MRENIALEVTHLGDTEPYVKQPIRTLIADYIKATTDIELIVRFKLEDFEVKALFC